MTRLLPEKGLEARKVLETLASYASIDMDPSSARLWGHIYEPGVEEVWKVALEAYALYQKKNMLDPTVYPSIIRIENELVSAVASLMGGGEGVVGNFTGGGTESIMLAVKAARDYYWSHRGRGTVPEIVLPITAHPAFHKAAHYLGLKTIVTPVDPETLQADVDAIAEKVSDRTAMVVGSAPNYPYGVIDPIREMGELAEDKGLWLHVDACIGFILPFLRMLGEPIPEYDFKVPGVSSLSTDLHKYGYSPKGASVILYRSKELRIHQLFSYSRWPGYPLVNTVVLSSRPAGNLAAAWAVLNYLGVEGYRRLAEKVLEARRTLEEQLPRLGFQVMGRPQAGILAFTSTEVNVFKLAQRMAEKGWYIQVQPGSIHLDLKPSIHLTIAPRHCDVVGQMLEDLARAKEEVRGHPLPPENALRFLQEAGLASLDPGELEKAMPRLLEGLGLTGEALPKDMSLINELMYLMPPEMVEQVLSLVMNELYSP